MYGLHVFQINLDPYKVFVHIYYMSSFFLRFMCLWNYMVMLIWRYNIYLYPKIKYHGILGLGKPHHIHKKSSM